MKRMTITVSLVLLGAALSLAQDSNAVKLTPGAATSPAVNAQPRERLFGAGLRISVLDKASLSLIFRPVPYLNLELGGFGTRKKSEGQYEYDYRLQAEADAVLMHSEQNRLFAGLRYSWERNREEQQYGDIIYYGSGSTTGTRYPTTTKISRVGLSVGADITVGRVGLQFGLTPLYDQQKTVTETYPLYYMYGARDTSVTHTENETVMEYTDFFVSFRFMF